METIWTNYIFPILTLLGFIILYFLSRNLLPSYFNEKGKNLATKEDVSEITKLVEGVKHSFTTETEKLRANLSILTNVKIGLFSEERNAIIDINEKYFKWLNILLDTSFGEIDAYNNLEIEKYQQLIRNSYIDFLNSETRFNLFVENQPLVELTSRMKLATLKQLNGLASTSLMRLKHNNLDIEALKNTTPFEEQREKRIALLQEREKIHRELGDSVVKEYKKIINLNMEFQRMSRESLYTLLNQQDKHKA